MHARVVIVGAARGVDQLTYAIPARLDGQVAPGHRVLVPVRSRRFTGVVTEIGENLEAGGADVKSLLELLEPHPLFDRAHLALMEFLSAYYMAPLAQTYRSVIPAAARVESRRVFEIDADPPPLAVAAFTPTERAIMEALRKRPMTAGQLKRCAAAPEVSGALRRLMSEGWIGLRDATRGRHRETRRLVVRLLTGSIPNPRGPRQREVVLRLERAATHEIAIVALEHEIPGARAIVKAMAARALVELVEEADAAGVDAVGKPSGAFELSDEQRAAYEAAASTIVGPGRRFETFLLWGVTASGKTEVYLRLAADALRAGRQVLVLVPEIALADELVRSFRARFGALVGVAHSAQSVAERWASWMGALSGRARIMIGPRSAVFAPLHDLGLIVVDEEHDPAYKQETGIRYHARDLAVALGHLSGCAVVLGSATPSAESFSNARRGRYRLLRLTRRVNQREMAAVEVIDLRAALGRPAPPAGSGGSPAHHPRSADAPLPVPISATLLDALRDNLAAGGQSIVFLNRRGYHNFLQCHLCGNVITCPNCSVSMTFHLRDRSVRCHYCGGRAGAPERCPACGGLGLTGRGFGTERLQVTLAEAMPEARIDRMDSDTSSRRGARARIVSAFRRGEIDVLTGTQMVTKGFDFPGVTLVGVVLADLALNLPDFRSAERTFQLLTQVAGRAGRGERPGRVLIQTYAPNHYSIRAARDQDYERFIRRELQLRREMGYPPFARLALVRLEGGEPARVSAIAERVAADLTAARDDRLRVLGPAPAPIERLRGRYRWQVMVKSPALKEMRAALSAMRAAVAEPAERAAVRVGIDIDPVNMM